jgi:tRNA-guanine family transglycosylase
MKFFVSWYPGDPWYPTYDAECNMLISVTSVSRDWRVIRYSHFPKSLVIDSGGYRFANNPDERLTPKAVLKKQLQMVGNQRIQTWVCALDYPILTPTMTANEKDYCIHQTIGYAYEMIEGMRQIKPEENIVAMAIVQGYDRHSYRFCAKELKAIGFNTFGLGSLISVKSERRMMERVDAVVQEVGAAVHVFGVSNLMMVKRFRDVGVESIDSSRPRCSTRYS